MVNIMSNNTIELKFTKVNGESYLSTTPMAGTISSTKFTFQQLRSCDLGISVTSGDELSVDIYGIDKKKKKYHLGTYKIRIQVEKEKRIFGVLKGQTNNILDEENNLKLNFTAIYYDEYKTYVLSNPLIQGNISYIKNII